jgi:hypothetical protein
LEMIGGSPRFFLIWIHLLFYVWPEINGDLWSSVDLITWMSVSQSLNHSMLILKYLSNHN